MQAVENWDDDVDLAGDLFAASNGSAAHSALSSRLSARSESVAGEEDWQLLLSPGDAASTSHAISSANNVGIPIPRNVPSSALLGGSIKRLGKTKSRQDVSDDWGDDFDVPAVGLGALKLRPPPAAIDVPGAPKTPGADADVEFDSEWAEGSLGIRFAGTRRDPVRNRSSSVSVMSPSMGSCMTLESEDDELGGLELPNEPIDFNGLLKKRKAVDYDAPTSAPPDPYAQNPPLDDDMMAGIELGATDLLDTKKRRINRNVKISQPKPPTPAARTAATLTFSEKSSMEKLSSRIPRPTPPPKSHKLDPVPESRNPAPPRPQFNRLTRNPPTTTSAQLLRSKRSAPVLGSRPSTGSRPPVPFLPAGVTTAQSHHINAKPSTSHLRQLSDDRPISPQVRRPSSSAYNDTPSKPAVPKGGTAVSLLRQAANQRTLQVNKRRNFGDGTELDRFDDLPTSTVKESKFVKEPSTRTLPKLRSTQSRRNLISRDETSYSPVAPSISSASTTVPTTPLAPPTPRSYFPKDNTPRFARDTAASRIAREQRLGPTPKPRGSGLVEAVSINWKAQVAARSPQTSPSAQRLKKRSEGRQPVLIKHMGSTATKRKSIDSVFASLTARRRKRNGVQPGPAAVGGQRARADQVREPVHVDAAAAPDAQGQPLAPPPHQQHPVGARRAGPARPQCSHAARGRAAAPGEPAAARAHLAHQRHARRRRRARHGVRPAADDVAQARRAGPGRRPGADGGGGGAAAALAAAAAAASGAGPGSISVEEEDDPFAGFDELVDERAAAVAVGAGGARAADKEQGRRRGGLDRRRGVRPGPGVRAQAARGGGRVAAQGGAVDGLAGGHGRGVEVGDSPGRGAVPRAGVMADPSRPAAYDEARKTQRLRL